MRRKNESDSNADQKILKKTFDNGYEQIDVTVRPIKSLDIQYDIRNTKIMSVDGALIAIEEGEGKILFYSTPLLQEPGVSLVQCPFEIRMKQSVLLAFIEDLVIRANAFFEKKHSKTTEKSSKKTSPEPMFG